MEEAKQVPVSRRESGKMTVNDMTKEVIKKSRQIPRNQIWSDLCDLIRRTPWTQEELEGLYNAIIGRFPSKQCVRCGKIKAVKLEGSVIEYVGERHFLCGQCQDALKEKESAQVNQNK